MRAFLRSPFVSALAGGAVVAVALLALDVDRGTRPAITVLEQAPRDATAAAATARGAPGAPGAETLTAREIYERDAPGVVFVHAASAPGATGGGTGFVIDRDGHVLTNHHVVGSARSVRLTFGDETTVTASVLGRDPRNDLALVRVDAGEVALRPLTLGDSDSLRVGDPVLAIGNPYGLERTLTTGVVSALHRQLRAPNDFTIPHVIQTDAPIHPGSSGGPLLDASGHVVGITSQIAVDAAGAGVGIGFAVPIDTATRLLPELKRTGTVSHAYLGISGVTIDASLSALQLRPRRGVLVQAVHAGSPAARAGVHGGTIESQVGATRLQLGGDVITSLDGATISSMEDLTEAMAERDPGERVRLGIVRDGEALQLTIRLGRAPDELPDGPDGP